MILHIIKSYRNQKRANLWIWMEMAFVSIILWVTVDIIYSFSVNYFKPVGHDINHVYRIYMYYDPNLEDTTDQSTIGEKLFTIIDRIRRYPGVESVSLSELAIPYCLGDRSIAAYSDTTKNSDLGVQNMQVTPDYFKVFKCTDEKGAIEPLVESLKQQEKVIINSRLKEALFEKGHPIGEKLFLGSNPNVKVREISNIISVFRRNNFMPERSLVFQLLRENDITAQSFIGSGLEVCVRVISDADAGFAERFKKETRSSLRIGGILMTDIIPMANQKTRANSIYIDTISQIGFIVIFLLINIFLGVTGTFWYRTRQRKSEMGLRIAMGSTRTGLQQLLIGEGLTLLAFATIPAIGIAFLIESAEIINLGKIPFTADRFIIGQIITISLMALMVIVGIYFPARSVSKLQPVEALRSE